MFRVQKDKDNSYVMLNKLFLENENLSWKAKGVLAYLLSLPDDWKIYEKELVNHSTDGIDSLRVGMKELIANGYVERKQAMCEGGKFSGYEYDVFEVPRHIGKSNSVTYKNEVKTDTNRIGKTVNGKTENGKTDNGKSNTTNNNLTNNNLTNNNLTNNEIYEFDNIKIFYEEHIKPLTDDLVTQRLKKMFDEVGLDNLKQAILETEKSGMLSMAIVGDFASRCKIKEG